MASIPNVTLKRLISTVPRFKKILSQASGRDVNESDTVTIVTDMLQEVFGYDKYQEITREYAIQGTYCDLAIKTNGKVDYLIEVKAIGLDLKESHMRQAIGYASREGIKWVVLTNGLKWEIHRVSLENKVVNEKVFELDFLEINPRKSDDQEKLFILCKRGVAKDLMDELYQHKQSVNRYTVGALIISEPVISAIKRELRKFKSGLKVSDEEIQTMVKEEILKRDLIESEAAQEAKKSIRKILNKAKKKKAIGKIKPQETANSEA